MVKWGVGFVLLGLFASCTSLGGGADGQDGSGHAGDGGGADAATTKDAAAPAHAPDAATSKPNPDATTLDAAHDSGARSTDADTATDAGAGPDATTECTANASSECHDGHVYWLSSCGERGLLRQECASGCADAHCLDCVPACDGAQ